MTLQGRRALLACVSAFALSGCATGYHDASNPVLGMFGGYTQSDGPGKLIKVQFFANGFSERERVGQFLLYRCAEVTQLRGKEYFALYATLPDAIQDKRSSARAVATVGGKPTSYAYILLLDAPAPGALSAKEVVERLKPEVTGEKKS
jgi:hypothetical protein